MTTTNGYVTELDYIPGFYRHMAPTELSFCAAINDAAPPDPTKPYRYLELGCGLGRVFTTLAASNPQSEFIGVDLNAAHIKKANEEIEASQLKNAKAITADITKLPNDLGDFDYIAVHGVLSWVPPKVQEAILTIGKTLLRQNGLLLLSYNILPGWAPIMPVRELMLQYTRNNDDAPLDKIAAALNYLNYIKNDAAYFKTNPYAAEHVDGLNELDPRYLVHEYLNECWSPLYFSDVHDRCADNNLSYVGQMPPPKNFDCTVSSDTLRELLQGAKTKRTVEIHKDYFNPGLFRWDIYTPADNAPKTKEPVATRLASMSATRYKTKSARHINGVSTRVGDAVIEINEPAQLKVLAKCTRSATLTEILADEALDAHDEITHAVMTCASFGALNIQIKKENAATPLKTMQYTLANKFNQVVAARDAFAGRPTALASQIAGSGVSLSDIEAGFTWLLTDGGEEKILDRAAVQLSEKGGSLMKKGQPITDNKEIIFALNNAYSKFKTNTLPKLVELGVLVPTQEIENE
jgi:SAM-dependent methyltransferase